MEQTANGTPTMKLVLVGDGAVGKTSMLISYTTNEFPSTYVPTIFDNYLAIVKYGGEMVKMWLWDTAGQQEYKRLRPLSYPKTDVFLICFSLIDCKSFNNALKKWLPEINEACPNAIKIFVGTKKDLVSEYEYKMNLKRGPIVVPYHIMDKKIRALGHTLMPCSAMVQDGLTEVFDQSIKLYMKSKNLTEVKKKTVRQDSCQII